jgi:adenylate kinase family enzyme/aminoglycoside phosphotransferase
MTNPFNKLELFKAHFPQEQIITVTENGGMEHLILEINGSWICKIAKNSSEGLTIESKVLKFLEGKLSTNIPKVAYYEPGFLVYRKIAGVELSEELYTKLNSTQKNNLATSIATFLTELHNINSQQVQALALPGHNWPWPTSQLIAHANAIQDPEIKQLFEQFISEYQTIQPNRFVLTHNDLISRNIIVDPATGQLSGIIDWTDVALQDPYLDLRMRWNSIPELVEATALKYARLTNLKLEPRLVYVYYFATELSRYIQQIQAQELDQISTTIARLRFAANKLQYSISRSLKIMIFGRPGGGKSTFANQLKSSLQIPVYHLDKYFYLSNWVERNYQEFLQIQQSFVNQDSWIIDGNSTKSLEMRYQKADLVVYLLLPRYLCLWRILKRYFSKDSKIDDRADNCPERINWKFLVYVWTFNQRVKQQIKTLQTKYPKVKLYTIKSDKELNQLYKKLIS